MNDNDLRALAAKLLKHYVAAQSPVAEAIVAQIPLDRVPAKVTPLITAEQRTLLNMLGGSWADIHEGKSVALIAQGCGGDDGDGGGDDEGDEADTNDTTTNDTTTTTTNDTTTTDLGEVDVAPATTTSVSVADISDMSPEMQAALANADISAPNTTATTNNATTTTGSTFGADISSALGIGSANATDFNPANSSMAAIQDAAKAAAANGALAGFLSSNPIYGANIDSQMMAQLQAANSAALAAQQSAAQKGATSQSGSPYGALTSFGKDLANQNTATTTTNTNPYGTLGYTPDQLAAMEALGIIGPIGSTVTSTTYPNIANIGQNIGTTTTTSPVTALTINKGASTDISKGTGTDTAPSVTTDLNINKGFGTDTTPAVTTTLDINKGFGTDTTPTTVQDLSKGTGTTISSPTTTIKEGGTGTVTGPIITANTSNATGATGVTGPAITTGITNVTGATGPVMTDMYGRQYIGPTGDLTQYGFGSEQMFYSPAIIPAKAMGGAFDASQYFAEGGLVSPLQPPEQTTVPSYPTMAFTDGQGAVGSIAQPPGLNNDQNAGFDAPNASPLAPSPAAASPSLQGPLQTIGTYSANAAPVQSQISQNPNVGYAVGKGPLSQI